MEQQDSRLIDGEGYDGGPFFRFRDFRVVEDIAGLYNGVQVSDGTNVGLDAGFPTG